MSGAYNHSMTRLKSRQRQIPGGFKFYQPETGWSSAPWASFSSICMSLELHRRGNLYLAQKHGWVMDPEGIEQEVEQFNVKLCRDHGWADYITEGGGDVPPAPKLMSPRTLLQSGGAVAGGIKTLADWEISGGNLVPRELAESRAATCASCPQNSPKDLTSWFTVPAASFIKAQLERRNHLKIQTAADPALGVCEACACPLKLKVHCPMAIIRKHQSAETRAALDPRCWILSEPA